MNAKMIIENLKTGINLDSVVPITDFPDNACKELRGVFSLVYDAIGYHSADPASKAAAILSIICVAGRLITVNEKGYRCNNGFIDSMGNFYYSDDPVRENLQLLAEEYIDESYFVGKAIDYLEHNGNTDESCKALQDYKALVHHALERCNDAVEIRRLDFLYNVIEVLERPIKVETVPTGWDHETWLKEFLPIWDRRNRWEQHAFRAEYYKKHVALVQSGCYISRSGKEVSIAWDKMERMRASKMYSHEMHIDPPEKKYETTVEVWQKDCLDAAKMLQQETEGVTAVLNLANRQNPGGGVYSGSGAQEESCFLRSDYFTTLYPYAEYAAQYGLPKAKDQYPLDRNFGGMWSSGVTIFRGRELEGYPLLDEPWKTNFIAVPAINRPATVVENGETRLRPDMEEGMLNKIRTIMNIAADNNVDNLVLGALGCGAFRNPPKHVAELFKQVLNEPPYKGRFNRIVFAIFNEELCRVFADVFDVRELMLRFKI